MITREQIPSVLEHAVYDTQGNKIGEAKHIFLDDVSGRPEWASVKTGMFGARESFVPIRDATLVEDHLEVPFDKAMVKDAPNVAIDSGGHLSAEEEHRLYEYYGVDWDTSWQSGQQGEGGTPGREAAGVAPVGGMGETSRLQEPEAGRGEQYEAEAEPTGLVGQPQRSGPADVQPGTGQQPSRAGTWEDGLTRSEEQMHVSTERTEVGRARLRKYVVTEHAEEQVPLSHEEVRVEREAITDANRGDLGRSDISEAQREVTLHADRPVIETETVPVERVRLNVEERTDQETVRGEVRKEQIDVELPEEETPGRPGRRPGRSGRGER